MSLRRAWFHVKRQRIQKPWCANRKGFISVSSKIKWGRIKQQFQPYIANYAMESKASKSRVMSVYFISRHIAGQVVYYSGCLRMHALLWSICREFSKSTLGQPPQTTSPCETDDNIILKYKSNRAFLLKNELLFKRISLLTILLFICKFFMWPGKQVIDSNAQKTIVFHPLDSIFSNCHRQLARAFR